MDIKDKIRNVPDFPKKGIVFRDITTLLKDKEALRYVIKKLANKYLDKKIDLVVGTESRGFIFGSLLAYELGVGFIPVRKKGKLPAEVVSEEYDLEYGKDCIEMHKDAIKPGQKILLVDDLVATGGTIKATAELVKQLGGDIIGMAFLIELSFLNPRKKLEGYDIFSLIKYDSEWILA